MNKKILAGTMAMALMAGQFSTMAFADSKETKPVAKTIVVKAQMVNGATDKTKITSQVLTEKELEELMKNWNGLKLNVGQIDGEMVLNEGKNVIPGTVMTFVTTADGKAIKVENIKATPMTKSISATQIVPARTKK